jgi:hypothetical protein
VSASAGELFDACTAAGGAGPRWRHGPPVLWLTSPAVQVSGRRWEARASRPSAGGGQVHGFSARQCRQVAAALIPVLGAHASLTERYAESAAAFPPPGAG